MVNLNAISSEFPEFIAKNANFRGDLANFHGF